MTIEELEVAWRSNPTLAESVRADLAKPHWSLFMQLLSAASYAKTLAPIQTHIITGHGDAMTGRILGYEQCMANIERFANQPKPAAAVRLDTYGVTAEDLHTS